MFKNLSCNLTQRSQKIAMSPCLQVVKVIYFKTLHVTGASKLKSCIADQQYNYLDVSTTTALLSRGLLKTN